MQTGKNNSERSVLGLDIGSASVGWALIRLNELDEPAGVIRAGARIFDAAVTGDIEKGQDESNAVARRQARLSRRQTSRRAGRQKELFKLLQKQELLPSYKGPLTGFSEQRHSILNQLDKQISVKLNDKKSAMNISDVPLYILRRIALDESLSPFELGRVFYHLSQRRGFLSNRREGNKQKKDDDRSVVKAGISELKQAILSAGARTLGEYFSTINPHDLRIRTRWTSREMYKDEFEEIWNAQKAHHSKLLTDELYHAIKRILFFQRPIKAQAGLIGKCELEPSERRASWGTLEAQRFRIWQKVNDLEIIKPGDVQGVRLTSEQCYSLFIYLDSRKDASFKAIREHLQLDKNIKFNLQRGGEKLLKGNLVQGIMLEAFGDSWNVKTAEDQFEIIEQWRTIEHPTGLEKRAKEVWGLTAEKAAWLAEQNPPDGYCSLSRKAIRRILPLMQDGKRFIEARDCFEEYRPQLASPLDRIPPVREFVKNLRNPAVERALTEVRKVVNAIVREHGKPYEVRIELARDLKKSRKEREESIDVNRKREAERKTAKSKLLNEVGIKNPSRSDIEKALLWEECGGICPYTGRQIDFRELFGSGPQFDVEHIIPYSRIPDDSFGNKTLCYHEENRNRKGNKTPFEAYGANTEDYETILARVRAWKPQNGGKLRRFTLRSLEELEGFSSRQLNDTRYMSSLACQLLGALYGGLKEPRGDGSNRQVIFATSGMVTATLRRAWGLEAILRESAPSANGENKGKPRTDHRHHAIDAITIALTSQRMVQTLSAAAARTGIYTQRPVRSLQGPWPNFVDGIRPVIADILISHRPNHKLQGALHEETNYGRPKIVNGKSFVHIRKPVVGLSAGDIESIVDPIVRRAVATKAIEIGDLKKCNPRPGVEDWPLLETKTGKLIPIKRVRIQKALTTEPIGKGERTRHVALGSNHHVAIYAEIDQHGKEKRWEPLIVSLFEAMQRKQRGEAVIQKKSPLGENYEFKFSLMGGDTLLLHKDCDHKMDKCNPSYWRLRTIATNGQLSLVRINDSRLIADIKKAKEWWSPAVDTLRKLEALKIFIDSIGRIHSSGE